MLRLYGAVIRDRTTIHVVSPAEERQNSSHNLFLHTVRPVVVFSLGYAYPRGYAKTSYGESIISR